MDNLIAVTLKNVYGETKAYPANVQAIRFARLLGTKTLTPVALNEITQMGFRVIEVDPFGQTVGEVRLAA